MMKPHLCYMLCGLVPIFLILNIYYFSHSQSDDHRLIPSTNNLIILTSPNKSSQVSEDFREKNAVRKTVPCEYSDGEWISNKLGSGEAPLYNGTTCDTIKKAQNCVLHGRPDKGYLHWRWKPKNCKLPGFDPKTFLKLLKNKHVAFVGDSLARNQLESMLCMLATVSKPILYYTGGEDYKLTRKWRFDRPHNINVSLYWSPFLVKLVEKTTNKEKDFHTLYLDVVDEKWAKDLDNMDVLVLSVGHWYLHPAVYRYKDSVIGCHSLENCTEVGFYDIYGKALETTFGSVIERKPAAGSISVFLMTFSPAHFEGEWDKFGACSKTQPYKESEMALRGVNEEMRKVGVSKLEEAKSRSDNNIRTRFEALDITKLALLRPDGHPGPYANPFPFANGISNRVQNDCLHWCLPGPIDVWNDILLDAMRRMFKLNDHHILLNF